MTLPCNKLTKNLAKIAHKFQKRTKLRGFNFPQENPQMYARALLQHDCKLGQNNLQLTTKTVVNQWVLMWDYS